LARRNRTRAPNDRRGGGGGPENRGFGLDKNVRGGKTYRRYEEWKLAAAEVWEQNQKGSLTRKR